jgi:hypothetical protein
MGIGYVALCIFSPDSGRGNPGFVETPGEFFLVTVKL